MKTKTIILLSLLIFILILFSCKVDRKANLNPEKQAWAIVIHGGAGGISRENITPEMDKEYRASLLIALNTGKKILAQGEQLLTQSNRLSGKWKIILSSMPGKVQCLLMTERMSLMRQLWMDQILSAGVKWQELLDIGSKLITAAKCVMTKIRT